MRITLLVGIVLLTRGLSQASERYVAVANMIGRPAAVAPVARRLERHGIRPRIGGSGLYAIWVPQSQQDRARRLLRTMNRRDADSAGLVVNRRKR